MTLSITLPHGLYKSGSKPIELKQIMTLPYPNLLFFVVFGSELIIHGMWILSDLKNGTEMEWNQRQINI